MGSQILDSLRPITVSSDIKKLEPRMDSRTSVDWNMVFIQYLNPSVHRVSADDVRHRQISSSDQCCTDRIIALDCEYNFRDRRVVYYEARI
ncbi:hypothetical protein RHMOL_Rhmol07G0256800 [Rhododendron molle]|uniref:Uncharacterized protein n=1 Tax=Rhododendron molle TaxID=49168 RepID=A0ACC0N5T9_RHOML|nr:hypothetical protein RHMOL_Rhmol07G0256800 [Rhododendron molle]